MQPKFRLWMMSLVLLVASSTAMAAGELYVVCHEGVALDAADIRDVFLGEKQFLNTTRLIPVDNLAAQPAFLDKVLRMDAVRYTNSWVKKSFRYGINPPAAMANDAAVLEFIKHAPGGCGYVNTAPRSGVNVIGKY
jgi:hypothetical protein